MVMSLECLAGHNLFALRYFSILAMFDGFVTLCKSLSAWPEAHTGNAKYGVQTDVHANVPHIL